MNKKRVEPYFLFVFIFGACLIYWSKYLAFRDQGDFARAIIGILSGPLLGFSDYGPCFGLLWFFAPHLMSPYDLLNTSRLLVWLSALIQSLYSVNYSLSDLALLSKILILWACKKITDELGQHLRFKQLGKTVIFVLLSAMTFASHNIAVLNTFYFEYAFFVFFPVLLLFLLRRPSSRTTIGLTIALYMCTLAKVQFFYLPTLTLLIFLLRKKIMKENVGRAMIIALCIVQGLGLIFLQNNEFRKQNYAHSTCFGSYLVMTDAELEAVGFPLAERESIGLDYWKNRIKGPGEERVRAPIPTKKIYL